MNIKDYFAFTKGEKRGSFVLLLIISLLIIANLSIGYFAPKTQTDFSEFKTAIDSFEREISNKKNTTETLTLFNFNPNSCSDEDLKKLGFANWQIKSINKYKAKGGKWKTKNDVKKIYGLSQDHFHQLEPYIQLPNKTNTNSSKKKKEVIRYFNFDPNTATESEWKKLGFKDWQIETIFNYKNKGGNWKTKSDVQKIYGLSENDFQKLKTYILLPEKKESKESFVKKDYTIMVDINKSTTKELTQLKGIHSEKYAAIIIKYRNKLGGFVRKEQLKEVWNMTSETYNNFEKQLDLGNSSPTQININAATIEELKTHPYIGWKIANTIVKYRKMHGNYSTLEDLKKIHLITAENYPKIVPYLKIN